jgi:hypothetical protein
VHGSLAPEISALEFHPIHLIDIFVRFLFPLIRFNHPFVYHYRPRHNVERDASEGPCRLPRTERLAAMEYINTFGGVYGTLLALGSDPARRRLSARNGAIKTDFAECVQR